MKKPKNNRKQEIFKASLLKFHEFYRDLSNDRYKVPSTSENDVAAIILITILGLF